MGSRLPGPAPEGRDARAAVNSSLAALDHEPCEVDFYWASHRLIVETDGWETHRSRQAFRNDRAKDATFTASGYKVLRFTWDVEPDVILRRLRALLG